MKTQNFSYFYTVEVKWWQRNLDILIINVSVINFKIDYEINLVTLLIFYNLYYQKQNEICTADWKPIRKA